MMNKYKIGIVGVGMVGGALKTYFEKKGIKPFLYDKGKDLGSVEDVNKADVVFLCVPTPYNKTSGFDLSYVEESCNYLNNEGKILVIKSTVLPGTTEKLQEKYPQHKFLFNPEFLVESKAEETMEKPDRQIMGYTKQSRNVAEEVMRMLPRASYQKVMPATEAEAVKYFGNTFLAMKVIFGNQMYDLCQKLGIDYDIVREAGSADPRIGPSHLDVFHARYRGYGGKCLNKDIRATIQLAKTIGVDMDLLEKTEEINNKLIEEQGIDDPEKYSERNPY